MLIKNAVLLAAAGFASSILASPVGNAGPYTATVSVTMPLHDTGLSTVDANQADVTTVGLSTVTALEADVTTVGLSTMTVFANDPTSTETTLPAAPAITATSTLGITSLSTLSVSTVASGNITTLVTDPSANGTFWTAGPSSSTAAPTSGAESPTGNSTSNSTADGTSPEETSSDHKNAASIAVDRGLFAVLAGLLVALAL
ncbi:hypothetical protein B0T14DRAFT_563873 [Immersiella caudata]|uniref:Uncharacterized protein n=1 Tax=Immersiella caudata TaxID=314043 RepID=A0AA39WVQ5_9PEZI|nr:hypothetical protein B0T14DRAFT_563873 [Immersiella caudata]